MSELQKDLVLSINEYAYVMDETKGHVDIAEKLALAEQAEQELRSTQLRNKLSLQREEALHKMNIQAELNRKDEAEKMAAKVAEQDMQIVLDAINNAKLERERVTNEARLNNMRAEAEIQKARQEAYAETVAKIMTSIGPDLVAAMNAKTNADMTKAIATSLAPYALAGDNESVSDVVNKLLRGTSLEDVVKDVNLNI